VEPPDPCHIRPGGPADASAVLAMFDAAVVWLIARGLSGQWGTEPFSAQPAQVAQVRAWAAGGGLWIAEVVGLPVGAMVLGDAPMYAPPTTIPELYVVALVADRNHGGQGIGRALLVHARLYAASLGLRQLRVDCWAGGEGALVRYYEAAGFSPVEPITIDRWQGRVLAQRW
jgi:GNAT superfamily N-acetyltransferase